MIIMAVVIMAGVRIMVHRDQICMEQNHTLQKPANQLLGAQNHLILKVRYEVRYPDPVLPVNPEAIHQVQAIHKNREVRLVTVARLREAEVVVLENSLILKL